MMSIITNVICLIAGASLLGGLGRVSKIKEGDSFA